MKKVMLMMAVTLMSALQVCAQTTQVADKELIGAWMLEWMQYDGEKKIMWQRNHLHFIQVLWCRRRVCLLRNRFEQGWQNCAHAP